MTPNSASESLLLDALNHNLANGDTLTSRLQQNLVQNSDAVWDLANRNRVTSVVAISLVKAWGAEQVALHWRQTIVNARDKISLALKELDRIACILEKNGINVVVLENGALARAVLPSPELYQFGDFDLLILPSHFTSVHTLVVNEGYHRISESGKYNGRVEYTRSLADSQELRLNFQSSLVARRWFSSHREPDCAVLLERSRKVPGSAVRILDSEDFLFQLCTHNASHAFVRKPGLRLHLDIDWYIRNKDIDWDSFVRLATQYRIQTIAYYSLAIPNRLFGTPVPNSVLNSLTPPTWRSGLLQRMIERAGLFHPDQKKFGRLSFVLFTMLLYDDWSGLWRGIFPDRAWMQNQYHFRTPLLLPYYHLRRLGNLLLRRLAT